MNVKKKYQEGRQDSIIILPELIEPKIYLIRNQKVMLDRDLATLYEVQTRVLNQAMKRNKGRFPIDFMFQLTKKEFENWRSQFVTSNSDRMGLRRPPFAFTDYGILMLSSVLSSERAVQVNIAIMRIFVRLREIMFANKDLALRLERLEHAVEKQQGQIHSIFEIVKQLMTVEEKPKRRIGFHDK
ncbi:MAG: ORF6N domain-containing protein [Candidatus Omnitrophota bacterium]|nr:ORF6N domain-containing protein [Candidatus Omnitrophota bacterium]